MEETTNSIKDAIKERLTNPFLGKLLLAWVIWNWKIPYISFFVSEENIIPPEGINSTNKLEFVSNYLTPDSFWDFCNIYLVPLLITAILIWVVPWVSDIVFNVSEKYRLKRALKTKNTDDEINSFTKKKIEELNLKINNVNENRNLLETFCEHLLDERKIILEKETISEAEFLEIFRESINQETVKDRVFNFIDTYNKTSSKSRFLNSQNYIEKEFLMSYAIIKENEQNNKMVLTGFGNFLSKKRIFRNMRRYGNLDIEKDFD